MKKQFIPLITLVIVFLATPFAVLAQSYSFSLDKENVIVYLNEDSSISLDYTFVFTNDNGAHEIDFVDVGMPNNSFDIGTVSAEVNGRRVNISSTQYQGRGSGFAVVLGAESIKPGQTGTVRVTVKRITSVLNRDSKDKKYASFEFTPTWFGPEYVHGNTDLTVAFHLPPGIQANEPRFHLPNGQWTGANEPAIGSDENGRITYIWHAENANGATPYVFGTSFPLSYVPDYASQLARERSRTLAGWIIFGSTVIFITGAFSFLKYSERRNNRLGYLSPQISIEGYGVRRGLTAVEAAIVLEQPLEKILTMILFGVVKKGAAKITNRDPLQLEVTTNLPEDLYAYEKDFLNAFRIEDARYREEKLQEMFIDLIKAVSEKLRGFSRDETQLYYRGLIQRAWQQVREAGTPEIKNREFDQSFDWLMLNYHFREDVQELFKDPGMATPQWWSAYDQGFKLPDNPLPKPGNPYEERSSQNNERPIFQPHSEPSPTAASEPFPIAREIKPASSTLPGADYAASIVNSVQDFSSKVIRDVNRFTDRVHEVANLRPDFSSSDHFFAPPAEEKQEDWERGGSSASADGFFSLFSSSGSDSSSHSSSSSYHSSSSSSSHHSSCACACAGCACACAGGGR